MVKRSTAVGLAALALGVVHPCAFAQSAPEPDPVPETPEPEMPTDAPKQDGGITPTPTQAGAPSGPVPTFLFDADPTADPRAAVAFGSARFTVLTPALIRMEWSADGVFEDRASQAFVNRRTPVPTFDAVRGADTITIETSDLKLTYRETGAGFTEDTLSVVLKRPVNGATVHWTPGTPDTGNLMGTARTLDGFSGAAPLETGLISRDGWVVVDDSDRLLFDGTAWNWMTTRREGEAIDWYFFGHGHDYARALRDFTLVAGPIPMVPRYVLGSWFSRYWPYTDHEYKAIVEEYRSHGVGIDVLVLDMDWHLDGWTGYTWNPRYFPDPSGFMRWCREHHVHTTLNLHPADGVGKHEACFRTMAAAMGVPRHVYRIPFDCTSKEFMRAYFDVLHHPLEAQGVDFWWMDWQQGTETKMPGLDPLFWLNHLHWQDMHTNAKRDDLRPLVFSRWGGLGNHRYQIGFSGDTFNDWESLAFQPYFTATAANVGYSWWSHDIGGHQPGPVEDELYVRWVQYGVFSPVLRLHSGREPRAERRIWKFSEDAFAELKEAFRLRYALVPYIYGATRDSFDSAVSLCRPMYHDWPEEARAYETPNQYMFGPDLMIAPVVGPMQPTSGGAPVDVWIPPSESGGWVEWATGRVHPGAEDARLLVPLDEIPIFAKCGAIVPEYTDAMRTPDRGPEELILNVFPVGSGTGGSASVYEDDGMTNGYRRDAFARTPVEQSADASGTRTITIGPAVGQYIGMPEKRTYEIRLRSEWPLERVEVDGVALSDAPNPGATGFRYDAETMSAVIRLAPRSVRDKAVIRATPAVRGEGAKAMGAGLLGQLNMLDDIAAALGAEAPRALADVCAIRNRIAGDPAGSARAAADLQSNWAALIDAIRTCGARDESKERAIARVLGISCEIAVEALAESEDAIAVRADLAFAPRFDAPKDMSVSLHIESGLGWTIGTQETEAPRKLSIGEHLRARAVLRADASMAALQTGHVTAHATVNDNGHRIEVRADQAFLPSINAWWIVGPFPCPWDEQMDREFIDVKAIDPSKPITRDDGTEVAWIKARREVTPGQKVQSEYRIDLLYSFDETRCDYAVAYAACDLESDTDREVELAIGSDDGLKVWVNGDVVHTKQIQRGYRPKEDRVLVRLKKGRNRLVLKITQREAGWFFGAHVQDASGLPVPSVRVRLDF